MKQLFVPEQVFATVQGCFVEALGVEEEEVTMKARVIDDLGAESLDFLDIAFRLERAFDIKIPRGDIERQAQESLDGDPYEVDGVLTASALNELKELMPEVDPEEFKPGLRTRDIAGLFLVETFYNLCARLVSAQREQAA